MLLKHLLTPLLAAGAATALPTEPLSKRGVQFNFGQDKVRGLNIGGWLVLEPWITPSIFQKLNGVVDEYTLTQQQGQDAAGAILREHWDNWVTLGDFQKIAGAGFNTVRIPVGYWAFETFNGDPYVQGAAEYLEKAIGWARSTGLKVWIDLHGAPGSQNGFDNSGQRLDSPGWQNGDNVANTLRVIERISDKYSRQEYQDVVVAIQLLNEPLGPKLDLNNIRQFYRDGYGKVRQNSDTPVVFSDAFQPASSWNNFLTPSDNNAQNVIVDHHEYQVFSNEQLRLQNYEHRQAVCNNRGSYTGADKWVVVGEWSGAQTDCAPALNGYGIGSRYSGDYPGSTRIGDCYRFNFIDQWDQTLRDDTRQFIEAQLDSYERFAQGWIFWNFKAEHAPEWNAFTLLDEGIFPQPLDDRKFGSVCG